MNFSEIKCIIDAFGSHLNIDLQQRSVEFSQLFKSNLRPALLEKMPPMQVTRNNQNSEFAEDGESIELIENGLEDNADAGNNKLPSSDSVRKKKK